MRVLSPVLVGLLVACSTEVEEQVGPDQALLSELDAATMGPDGSRTAWPIYQRLLADFAEPPAGTCFTWEVVPGSQSWHRLAAWLERNRSALPVLLEASQRPYYGRSYRPESGSREPYDRSSLYSDRMLTNFLCAASREAAGDGHLGEAIDYALTSLRFAAQILQRPTVGEQAVGSVCAGIGLRELQRLLLEHSADWSEEQLSRVAADPVLRTGLTPSGRAQELYRAFWGEGDEFPTSWWNGMAAQHARQNHLTRILVELVAYRQAQGEFPDSLEAIDRALVQQIDRLCYLPPTEDRGLVLYQLGEDGEDSICGSDLGTEVPSLSRRHWVGDEQVLVLAH